MPINKGALIRRQVLDHCLSSGLNYTLLQLMDKCNEQLRLNGYKIVTSENTIRADLRALETQYPQAEVQDIHQGRNIFYRYKDKNFSIYKVPLSDKEIMGLTQAIALLSRFEGMPGSEWLDSIIERFKPSLGIDTNVGNIVGFDVNIDLKGREHFAALLQATTNKQVLIIRHFSYRTKQEYTSTIHPYYIKEYNNRWFLIGWNDEQNMLFNLAFDRILEITPIPKKFRLNEDIDFFDYFDEMVGVSRKSDDKPQKVRFWASNDSVPYIQSKPFHGTQHIIEYCNDGAIFEIDVIINFELEQLILSFCNNIKVLSPDSLSQRIAHRISEANKKYK